MTALSKFSKEEREILVNLPYQVGLLIAYADEDAEVEKTDHEEQALQRTLNLLPGLYEHAPVVQEILKFTAGLAEDNPQMDIPGNIDQICAQAVGMLQDKASLQEAKAYRSVLLEIADTVARAAGVEGAVEIRHEPSEGIMKMVLDTMKAIGLASKPKGEANISQAERALINKLDTAMQI